MIKLTMKNADKQHWRIDGQVFKTDDKLLIKWIKNVLKSLKTVDKIDYESWKKWSKNYWQKD